MREAVSPTEPAVAAPRLAGRYGLVVVVVAWVVAMVPYLVHRPDLVLDDWFTLGADRVLPAAEAAGAGAARDRPGAWVTYLVVFGGIGDQPGLVLAVQAAIGLATAVALWRLLLRFAPPALAVATVVTWLVLPNHTSLEVWASASNIGVALLGLVLGLLALTGPPSRWRGPAAAVALCAAALCYEAVLPAAAVGSVALPWLGARQPRWAVSAWGLGGTAVAGLWYATHWHPAKGVQGIADLGQAIPGHLGWGVLPDGLLADVLMVVGLCGVLVAALQVLGPRRASAGVAERYVLAGALVIAVGVSPFLRYFYAPLGAGDRFNVVSAVGGAMVWAGLAAMAWRIRRELAAALAVVLLVGGLVARWERADRWARAGDDARATLAVVAARWPDPPDHPIVFGPRPVQEANVAAFVDPSNLRGALRFLYGVDGVEAILTFSSEEFASYPEAWRVDLGELATLEPEDTVEPG